MRNQCRRSAFVPKVAGKSGGCGFRVNREIQAFIGLLFDHNPRSLKEEDTLIQLSPKQNKKASSDLPNAGRESSTSIEVILSSSLLNVTNTNFTMFSLSLKNNRALLKKIREKKTFFRKMAKQSESWEDIVIPGFDQMVEPEDLFALCVFIGNAIFTRIPIIVGFEGVAASGKLTLCRIIQKIATKNKLVNLIVSQINTILEETETKQSICYFNECYIPEDSNVKRCTVPTFFCCNPQIHDYDPGYQHNHEMIKMVKPRLTNSRFLESIDIDLVEEKCLQALIHQKTVPSDDFRLKLITDNVVPRV
jgi:hypothetical protein